MKKRILALFLAVIMTAALIPATASAANSDFVIEDGVLTRYKGPGGNVTIPSGVTSIGYAAFSDCTSLTSVTIPASVTSINEYRSFDGCTGLTAIHVDPNNQDYASTDGVLFTKDMKTLIDCPEGKQGRYAIPAGVTSIEWEAFADCTGLTSVVIPDSVTSFEGSAFRGCTGLTGVTISAGVTSIESNTFYRCAGLTSVTIPSGVTSIESGAFADCTSLTSVTIPSGVTSIDSSAFSGTPWLESLGKFATVNGILIKYQGKDREVTIPDNVTSISSGAFYGCTSLVSVVIPDSVTSVGYGAFSDCTSLTSVTIPDSVTSIEDSMFEGCTSLTSVTIPDSVTSIGWSAFAGCTGLTSVTIGDGVTYIGSGAFEGCDSLTSVYITDITVWCGINDPGGSGSPLRYAKNLYLNGELVSDLIIPESVTSIGDGVFSGYVGLTSVKIPSSVTSIGGYAFENCTSLTSVTIPNSVTDIGGDPFYGCTSLTIYGEAGSYAEQYCAENDIPFMVLTAYQGTLTGSDGKSLEWTANTTGQVSVSEDQLAPGEAVLVGCYDSQGRFTGVKVLDAQDPTDTIDPKTPNVKLFWLNAASQPQSPSATVWGK